MSSRKIATPAPCSGFWQGVHDACWIHALFLFFLFSLSKGEQLEDLPPFFLLFAVFYIVVAEWAGYAARRAARREWYERVGRQLADGSGSATRAIHGRAPKSVKKDIYL